MPSHAEGLLAQIRQGVVDPNTSLSTLLNMCLVLGGQAKSEKLRDWARNELNGYPDPKPDDVPAYRRVPAVITVQITNKAGYNGRPQNFRNAQLPRQFVDLYDTEEMIVQYGVGELEAFVRSGEETLHFTPGWAPMLCELLNRFAIKDEYTHAADAYWVVRPAVFEGVLSRIRSALADLVAELDIQMPDDQTVPDQGLADRAVQFVFTGERPSVTYVSQHAKDSGSNTVSTGGGTTIGSQNADGSGTVVGSQQAGDHGVLAGHDASMSAASDGSHDGFWARLRKRGAVVAVAQIGGAIVGLASLVLAVWLAAGWPAPWN